MGKKHSVELLKDKCVGCTDCIKRCPTEAIRVRQGKAVILEDKCVDCGLCIRVCTHHAKRAATQEMRYTKNYKYRVALPAPALYSQFKDVTDVNAILTALKQLGFDDVFEVSFAAEQVTRVTKEALAGWNLKTPVISSACPVIIRLIAMRFPSLLENVLPVISPAEVMAIAAKNKMEKQGIPRDEIGVFFISPCAAKNTYMMNPIGIEKSEIDGVISIQDVYMTMRNKLRNMDEPEILSQSGSHGVEWARTGGEMYGSGVANSIAVDGIENVINVLEEVENGQLDNVNFIEGLACTAGCVGGPLTVSNNFVAKSRLWHVARAVEKLEPSQKRITDFSADEIKFRFTREVEPTEVAKLGDDMKTAIAKLERISEINAKLPKIDCGSCGAPTCQALAEDIVRGESNEEDCVFMLREKVKQLAEVMVNLSSKLPQTIRESE